MTRLLYVSGDASLARRTLRLYVQVVGKAFQAGSAGANADADTDRNWVETLVFGVRMFCKIASTTLSSSVHTREVLQDLREAESLIAKAKGRLDRDNKALAGSVELAEGIWNTVMALKGKHQCCVRCTFAETLKNTTHTHGQSALQRPTLSS